MERNTLKFPACPVTGDEVLLSLGVLMSTQAVRIDCPKCGNVHVLEPSRLRFSDRTEALAASG